MKKLFARTTYFAIMMSFSLQAFANGLEAGDKVMNKSTGEICQVHNSFGEFVVLKPLGIGGLFDSISPLNLSKPEHCSNYKKISKKVTPEEAAKRIQLAKLERIGGEVVRVEPGTKTITDGNTHRGGR